MTERTRQRKKADGMDIDFARHVIRASFASGRVLGDLVVFSKAHMNPKEHKPFGMGIAKALYEMQEATMGKALRRLSGAGSGSRGSDREIRPVLAARPGSPLWRGKRGEVSGSSLMLGLMASQG